MFWIWWKQSSRQKKKKKKKKKKTETNKQNDGEEKIVAELKLNEFRIKRLYILTLEKKTSSL